MILATVPIAFIGGILALLLAGETWNVSSLVGLIGLFGIAVQNSLRRRPWPDAVRDEVRPPARDRCSDLRLLPGRDPRGARERRNSRRDCRLHFR